MRGVVLTPWPDDPTALQLSNRRTIESFAGIPVSVLPPTRPDSASLAAAGRGLPLSDWLGS